MQALLFHPAFTEKNLAFVNQFPDIAPALCFAQRRCR